MGVEYRLTARIEAGDLAELFRAKRSDGEPVVIRLFHPKTSDPRFAHEVAETSRALGQVPGGGVARVLDLGLIGDRLAVVRDHAHCYTLAQVLGRLGTREVLLPSTIALSLVIELLEIAQRAHDAGVVHASISPASALLSREGRPALCDFELHRGLAAVPPLRRAFGARRGAYRAPELSRDESPTPLVDVYSLGALAYELLTLREPGPAATTVSVRRDALPAPSRVDRRLNSRLDPIVMRALEAQPARRFRSCAEMAGALREFLSTSGGMPTRDDLTRFVLEVFPAGTSLEAAGPVPFERAFSLDEITNARLPPVADEPVVEPEPSAGDASTAATQEAVPIVGEPLGWEAPPGPEPSRARRPAAPAAGRVKLIEDFTAPAPPEEPESTRGRRERPAVPTTISMEALPAPELSQPSDPEFPKVIEPDGRRRAMVTEERNLFRDAKRRRQMLLVAGAVAVGAAASFAVMGLLFSEPAADPDQPLAEAAEEPVPAPKPELRPSPPPEPDRPDERKAPPKRAVGYLTITSNVPATVYVDGRRLRGQTPLKGYPVAVGKRKIALVALRTKERRELTVTVRQGKTVKLEERFRPGRRR